MWNALPPSPGRACSREQQRATDIFASRYPLDKPGAHSVWCDLVLVERGYYPLLARSVVVVLTQDKLFLRVAATAFTFTIYFRDVLQLRYVVPNDVVELHVRLPDASSSPPVEGHHTDGCATQRLYRVAVTERHTGVGAQLFRTLVASLFLPSPQCVAEETFTDDAVFAYLVDQPCSMLPQHLLDRSGLREIEWVERTPPIPLSTPSARSSANSVMPPPLPPPPPLCGPANSAVIPPSGDDGAGVTTASAALPSYSTTTGHLHKIYVAASPAFWKLPRSASPTRQRDLPLTWPCVREQTSLPHAENDATVHGALPVNSPSTSQPPYTGHRAHNETPPAHNLTPDIADTNSRESSLAAGVYDQRFLAAIASAPSSRTSLRTDRTLKVQYGPITSG
ncbi:hypothetical protein ABL78_1980 [Leptomonas seymouri]|uniref:Uncharacterized protein n=1 Tax=Leptomonas seymouri TaxID=5684 RepID=A0A0N1PEP2_LEPSE|nr:hypothetical protein ABL78_1980 [Leptomonas seymouri]|eukprot:KPI88935.1 hypothetical protein ABL78_1980 [Leptomonas seymouri]